jgi:hypothetical protein
MGVRLEQNAKYLVSVKAVDSFMDNGIEASRGFYS